MKFNWKLGKDKWLILLAVDFCSWSSRFHPVRRRKKKMLKDAASGTEASLQEGLVTEAGEPGRPQMRTAPMNSGWNSG